MSMIDDIYDEARIDKIRLHLEQCSYVPAAATNHRGDMGYLLAVAAKLREMCVEKDANIHALRHQITGYSARLAEKGAEIERLRERVKELEDRTE